MKDDQILEHYAAEIEADTELMRMSNAQKSMIGNIIDRQSERLKGYRTELVKQWFPLTDLADPAYIGSFTINAFQRKHKWIMHKFARNINGMHYVTPGDLARDYLNIKYPNRKPRMTTRQYQDIVKVQRQPPLYCQPCDLEHAHYIDIRSAYWSILKTCSWDVDYCPGRILGAGSDLTDFPFSFDKMARNTLVTSGLPMSFQLWTGSEAITRQGGSKLINLVLWAYVMDVLNGVAHDAIEAGSVYCFTDGFIVPDDRLTSVMGAIEAWGLPFTIKASGQAEVRQAGNYRVGDKQSRPYKMQLKRSSIRIVNTFHRDWLRWRVAEFSRREGSKYLDNV